MVSTRVSAAAIRRSGCWYSDVHLAACPMRILVSTGLFPNRLNPQRGIYILRQAVALRRYAQIRVIAPVPYVPAWMSWGQYGGLSRIPSRDRIEDIDVSYPRYFVVPKLLRFHHGVLVAASMLPCFRRVVREFRPDAVITFFAYPYGYATVHLARMFGLPVATGLLGSDINVMAQRGIRRRMIRSSLNASHRVFSVSRALRDATIAIGVRPENIAVIPNGVERGSFGRLTKTEAREVLGLAPGGKVLLCVANLVRVKGVDLLVEAVKRLRDAEATLIVVGDGEERRTLEAMVVDYGLQSRVRFVGMRAPAEIPAWMAAADVVVLASRFEGHPNVVVEALASGRPVVATSVGGVPELITSENLGLTVEPDDPASLADAIGSALSREWDENAIRRAGNARTWDDVAEELVTELRRMTASQVRNGL